MKKFKLILFLALFFEFTATAQQDWVWARASAGNGAHIAYHNTLDEEGNIYVGGYNTGMAVFECDTLNCNGGTDGILVKYDRAGNVLWARGLGGSDSDFAGWPSVDNQGNVYISGYFLSTDFSVGDFDLTIAGDREIFIAKYDSDGNVLWAKSYGGTGLDNSYSRIAVDDENNIYMTGGFSNTASFDEFEFTSNGGEDIFLIKMNSDGDVQWAQAWGEGGNDEAYNMTYSNGKVYLAGNISTNGAVYCYDTDGNLQWQGLQQGTWVTWTNEVIVNNVGDVYAAGRFEDASFTVGDTTVYNAQAGLRDNYVVKYDSEGSFQWVRVFGGTNNESEVPALAADSEDNIYFLTYSISSPISFDSFDFTDLGDNDIYLVKLDSDGNVTDAHQFGSPGNDVAYGISVDENDQLFLSGGFSYNPLELGTLTLPLNGSFNTFTGKFGTFMALSCSAPDYFCVNYAENFDVPYIATGAFNSGNTFTAQLSDMYGRFCNPIDIGTLTSTESGNINCLIPVDTEPGTGYRIRVIADLPWFMGSDNGIDITLDLCFGIDEEKNEFDLSLSPNPTHNDVVCNFTLQQASELHIELLNILGEKITDENSHATKYFSAGTHAEKISLAHLPAGVYVVQMNSGDDVWSERVVRE